MKKALSVILAMAMILSLSVSALAADDSPKVVEGSVAWPVVLGSEETPANKASFYRYTPDDFKFRGNSTPVLFVLGGAAWTETSANEALVRGGFDQMAQEESGHVVFVSPVDGKAWGADDYAVLQALAANVTDEYFYADDVKGVYGSGVAEDGRLYAGRFRSYTFAEGSAQDFVKQYLDTPEANHLVPDWFSTTSRFGAGFHYAEQFDREDNLQAWETLRRTNHVTMMDGVSYLDRYTVYADLGIDETLNDFTAASGNSFEYYQYVPQSVDLTSATETYPLVFVFHGYGQHPDGYIHLTNWPVTGDKHGFITVAVNGDQKDADLLELLDSLIAKYPIDTGRVYSTGYSQGGMKSYSLGFEHTGRFAAVAPTEAIPGMGESPIPYEAPAQKIPTFIVLGEGEFYDLFPMNTEYAIDLISLLAETNGFAYNGKYDEGLGKYFGMEASRTYTYDRAPGYHGDAGVWTIHEMDGEDGVPNTLISSVSKLGHSAFLPEPERIWQFFSHFTRAGDGSSVYTATPYADVKASSWYGAAVVHALDNGIMDSISATSFAPGQALTGPELASALHALAGTPATGDIPAWAGENGLPSSGETVTRAQMADALCVLAELMGKDVSAQGDLSAFSDAASASDGLAWAVGAELISGRPGALLDPDGAVTRAEAAVIFLRLNAFLA